MIQISKRVEQVANTTSLTYGWALLLLQELNWSMDNIEDYFLKP